MAAIAVLAAALTPVTWLRSSVEWTQSQQLDMSPIDAVTPADWPAGLSLTGAWELSSPDFRFGSYSALLIGEDGMFEAYDDKSFKARISMPGSSQNQVEIEQFRPHPAIQRYRDVEAATRDPATGTRWFAYEFHNAIVRLRPDGSAQVVRPAEMRDWGLNSGPEAMVRLADGRFLVLSEDDGVGLLFDGDPVDGAPVTRFALAGPEDFEPTDMAQLPDGRVLVLMRATRLAFPPFESLLALVDPATIADGRGRELHELARIEGRGIRENYEGLALEEDGAGGIVIWIISDDNRSGFQRTLLLQMRWRPGAANERARGDEPRAPENSG